MISIEPQKSVKQALIELCKDRIEHDSNPHRWVGALKLANQIEEKPPATAISDEAWKAVENFGSKPGALKDLKEHIEAMPVGARKLKLRKLANQIQEATPAAPAEAKQKALDRIYNARTAMGGDHFAHLVSETLDDFAASIGGEATPEASNDN